MSGDTVHFSAQQRHVLVLADESGQSRVGAGASRVAVWRARNPFGGPARGGDLVGRFEPANWYAVRRAVLEAMTFSLQLVADHRRPANEYAAPAHQDAGQLRPNLSTSVVGVDATGRPALRGDLHDLLRVDYSMPSGRSRAMLWIGGELGEIRKAAYRGMPAVGSMARGGREPGEFPGHAGGLVADDDAVGYLGTSLVLNPDDAYGRTRSGKAIVPPALYGGIHFEDGLLHGPLERGPLAGSGSGTAATSSGPRPSRSPRPAASP